jgi:ParB family chromosome partitioning protein
VSPQDTKRRLGRGLEALLGAGTVEEAEREGSLRELLVADIKPNRYQPRRAFDAEALKELRDSIATNGLVQPIVVRYAVRGEGYEIVAGERRWRCAKDLGWKKVPAVVRDVDEQTMLTLALVENLQRASLSPIDEAEGYERLARDFSMTHAQIAHAVGRERSTVANAIRLLALPKAVQSLLDSGALTAGHARALLSLDDQREIARVAREAVAHGWSVRETENHTRGDGGAKKKVARAAKRSLPPEVRRIEEALRKKLGTDVAVALRGKDKGHVAIRFYSHDDLARLLEIMLGRRWDG